MLVQKQNLGSVLPTSRCFADHVGWKEMSNSYFAALGRVGIDMQTHSSFQGDVDVAETKLRDLYMGP
jgi:hypothetical protein